MNATPDLSTNLGGLAVKLPQRLKTVEKLCLKLVVRVLVLVVLIIVTVYLVRAFDSRRRPDLMPWHQVSLDSEFRARDDRPDMTFREYQHIEDRLFSELKTEVYRKVEPTDDLALSRYDPGGFNDPMGFPQNWNRSYELIPGKIRGGVLLLHGLTDSPYSLRKVGEIFESQGFYVLGLRLPGHGTAPGSLASVTWADWMAATRLGARHVHEQVGQHGPFYLVGYSNGGGLAVKYAIQAINAADLPRPERLILFSPAIGVTRFASLTSWHKAVSWMGYFKKFKWDSIGPEYDPYKYNSFPKHAADQTHLLTKSIHKDINAIKRANRISQLPPILTFQSLVDTTVLTDAIVDRLYGNLQGNGHELVLFDINRVAQVRIFLTSDHRSLLHKLETKVNLPYTLTLITNASEDSLEVVERRKTPGSTVAASVSLGLHWPAGVYSLSHVAIPFSPDDWIYGDGRVERAGYGIRLGAIQPRGERNLLRVSVQQLMRLRHNPFFDYIEKRLIDELSAISTVDGAEPSRPAPVTDPE